jgi:hypothetical protein
MVSITDEQQEVLDKYTPKKLLKMGAGEICYIIWDKKLCAVKFETDGQYGCKYCPFFDEREGRNVKGDSEYTDNLKVLEKIRKLDL